MHHVKEVKLLVDNLNKHRHAYYNLNAPVISDAEYDRLYEQLESLERETGIIYSNSPTQTVGYPPVSELEKVPHPHPLLSLDKTKQVEELCRFCGDHAALLMLKLDGLTVKLTYENGRLAEASTRETGRSGKISPITFPPLRMYRSPLLLRNDWLSPGKPSYTERILNG